MTATQTVVPHIAIVGGGVAAGFLLRSLSARGYVGTVTVFSAETHRPYDRTEVSKGIVKSGPVGVRYLTDDVLVAEFVHETVVRLDVDLFEVETASGIQKFDALVIATGSTPLTLAGLDDATPIYTLDSALRVHGDADRAVVLGGGFIGSELGVALWNRGREVTVLDVAGLPLQSRIGDQLASALLSHWPRDVWRGETTIAERLRRGEFRLSDGSTLSTSSVYSALGARPDGRLYEGTPLAQRDGRVIVDDGAETSAHNVYAIGDCATWQIEPDAAWHVGAHWDDARASAEACASTLTGSNRPALSSYTPYFWSDQFAGRVQVVGSFRPDAQDISVLRDFGATGDDTKVTGLALATDRETSAVRAVVMLNLPRLLSPANRVVQNRSGLDEATSALGVEGARR